MEKFESVGTKKAKPYWISPSDLECKDLKKLIFLGLSFFLIQFGFKFRKFEILFF
ncbi:hypothetical protein SAMN05444412_101134 [Rhodonellum ikkaensis]|uniref:Uncharacterized protein n=1 Tax=Rhodonellum ikkaensis TaxID=336829 RepID=A0A1H3JTG4_9BACT|nr:hypothetical protein SAMN05444412_101134 [Rhodonellum ikkaensis]